MTKQEAMSLYSLECTECREVYDFPPCGDCTNVIAIECIEKQIPRKPIWRWDGNETIIECPNCGKYPFDMSEYEWARQFCGNCGQAILWESD